MTVTVCDGRRKVFLCVEFRPRCVMSRRVRRVAIPGQSRAGGVERAVRAELRRLHCSVASEGLGALAVSLARQIDSSRGAVAAAAAAGQLRLILADISKSSLPSEDVIDELNARRAVRRAG